MAERLTEKTGLPPLEPPKANDGTNPNAPNSKQAEVSSPANQNCETKPTSGVGDPERREHESYTNMKWLGVKFIEGAEDEAFIQSLIAGDGQDLLQDSLEPLSDENTQK
jgi:hypothetical protein